MMFICLLIFICIPAFSVTDSRYECGPHGRFEYCIDGIPGCVIGCHCHPGYFFDTDTKICESNTKLTQDYRRHYLSGPIPEQASSSTTTTLENIFRDPVDQKVDEITNDADDLGDWLYNQFFKTIENQVINKTNGEDLLTRRSGSFKMPTRKSRKTGHGRRKNKRKHSKSKLLRIADDSFFESDSGSSSNSKSSSRSSSSSSSTEDEEEKEKKGRGDRNYKDYDKKRKHGHKKIIIFNKKPKPPLPSFIFLPNMDTPFYPPIGLPPPPALQMYPMVPVPPVMGPMYPYPALTPNCEETTTADHTTTEAKTTSTSDATTAHDTSKAATVETSTPADVPTDTAIPEDGATGEPPAPSRLRSRHRSRNKSKGKKESNIMNMSDDYRDQLIKKFRDKLKRKNKLQKFFMDAEAQFMDKESLYAPPELPPDFDVKPSLVEKPPLSNVNFNYLSELIHEIDQNKTKLRPPNSQFNIILNNTNTPQSRRKYFEVPDYYNSYQSPVNKMEIRQSPKIREIGESYYANLGKQIASMIRNIDANGEHEVNIELQQTNFGNPSNPIFNGNHGSRSYWERSVRSPLKYLNNYNTNLEQSNEDLIKLESQVETAATTIPTLTLQQLERIIYKIKNSNLQEKPTKRIIPLHYTDDHANNATPSKISLNVNMLPPLLNPFQQYQTKPLQETGKPSSSLKMINQQNAQPQFDLNNANPYNNIRRHSIGNRENNFTNFGKYSVQNIKPIPNVFSIVSNKPKYGSFSKFNPPANQANVTNGKYYFNPMFLNHKKLNYYSNNKNRYLYEKKENMPFHISNYAQSFKPFVNNNNNSYFHHEFHHFDYFDQWK